MNSVYSKWLRYSAAAPGVYEIAGMGLCRSHDIVTPTVTRLNMPVTGIKKDAFRYDRRIESVVVSEGVTRIGAYAFSGCTELKMVVLPSTLTYIEDGAFSECPRLEEINIPVSVKEIPYAMLKGCAALRALDIAHIEKLGAEAFAGCASLVDVKMPNNPFFMSTENFRELGAFSDRTAWSGNVLTVDGYVMGCRDKRAVYELSRDVRCIVADAFSAARKYTEEANPTYQAELEEYRKQMDCFEQCLQCPNMPFCPPPDVYPSAYRSVCVPIQIHYEGTLAEWDEIVVFSSQDLYPAEITASDGAKSVRI